MSIYKQMNIVFSQKKNREQARIASRKRANSGQVSSDSNFLAKIKMRRAFWSHIVWQVFVLVSTFPSKKEHKYR